MTKAPMGRDEVEYTKREPALTRAGARKIVENWWFENSIPYIEPNHHDLHNAMLILTEEPVWLDLKTHPLDESMVGQWAWVREYDSERNKEDIYPARISDLFFYLPEDARNTGDYFECMSDLKNTYNITHYQIIGFSPPFKEKA